MSLKADIFSPFEKDKTDKLCKINYANGLEPWALGLCSIWNYRNGKLVGGEHKLLLIFPEN